MHDTEAPKRTAVIAAVQLPKVNDVEHASNVAELGRLLKTLGYEVVGTVTQRRDGLSAGAVFGGGKLVELAAYTGGSGIVESAAPSAKPADSDEQALPVIVDLPEDQPHADVVVVDHEISPRQARNLERATSAEVLDRTGVIVEIFHRHASTREARLQVEIARLSYVVPRLRAGVRGNDRQRGGVGGKGAGESSLELDRRKVRDRVSELRAELAAIAREEDNRRERRKSVNRVGLVGYTNAGKSSLMRALTGSEVYVENKLFATLGTTVRALHPEVVPRILISDTVGFIKKLPHDLVASFRSTLNEALEASLLLYVVDCSDPDFQGQLEVTREVLTEIGADVVPSRLVLNKIDQINALTHAELTEAYPDAIMLSAHNPADVGTLHATLVSFFESRFEEAEIFVPYAEGRVLGEIRAAMKVLGDRYDAQGTHVRVLGPAAEVARVKSLLA
ncbi:MAG: GTP-binding protein HflX [Myxococcota bacterium]|jgi:GTP-binding protein HflX